MSFLDLLALRKAGCHPFFTVVGDLLIYFHDYLTFTFSLGRASKEREAHCDSVDIFAAAPQLANITKIIIVIVIFSIVIVNNVVIVSIFIISLVITSIVTVTISIIMSSLSWQVAWENPWHPECLICMGKLMAWVNPWILPWENPWHEKVKVLTVVGGTVEKNHKYLASYFGRSFIIFDESN